MKTRGENLLSTHDGLCLGLALVHLLPAPQKWGMPAKNCFRLNTCSSVVNIKINIR